MPTTTNAAVSFLPSPAAQAPRKRSPKLLSMLLRTLIMVLIILLFFVLVGVAAILFLHICLAGRAALHRRNHRRYRPRDGETRSGYSMDELMVLLPRRRYREAEEEGGNSNNHSRELLCAICLDNVGEGEWCGRLPDCGHLFHSGCIERWLIKATSCPVCRCRVVLDCDRSRPGSTMECF